jgi:hypothetical protein
MDIQIHGAAEALDDRDGPAPAVCDAAAARACTQKAEDGTRVHTHDRATQIVIPREQVPQTVRQAQHPLANRDVGEYVVNQVSRAFGHASAAAAGTESAALARERYEPIVATRVAVKAGESRGQTPTREELPKLAFDKPRQAVAVAQRGRLRAERLEMITHELREHALCRIARLVSSGCLEHARRARVRRAARRRDECGRNRTISPSPVAIPAPPKTHRDRNT